MEGDRTDENGHSVVRLTDQNETAVLLIGSRTKRSGNMLSQLPKDVVNLIAGMTRGQGILPARETHPEGTAAKKHRI